MTPDREDPILDSCLDEVLGGRRPPDLTARILQAFEERRRSGSLPSSPDLSGLVVQPSLAAHANGRAVSLPQRDHRRRAASGQRWKWLVMAASVGGLGIALGISALQWFPPGRPVDQLAVNPQKPQDKRENTLVNDRDASPRDIVRQENSDRSRAADRIAVSDDGPKVVIPLDVPSSNVPNDADQLPPAGNQRRYAQQPISDSELLSLVNAELQRSWQEANVAPASPARDSEWCRRVYLGLLGRIPTKAEVTAFVENKSRDKKQQLVDRLLGDEYAEQFAQHWSSVWTNVLIGRTGGSEGSLASREGLENYLDRSLRENKPYDALVTELLTATGANRPGAADHNGAVNFLLAGLNDDATLATSRVSRVLLGQQLHCAQCHEHPSQEWSQQQYWALNSFLRQIEAKREGDIVRLVGADFVNKLPVTKDGEVYYRQPNEEVKAALPQFIDGTKVPSSGKLAEVDRRQELARLVVNSSEMPRALVNRLWSHFFGYGFTRPIDDMGPHNTPSHPQVLDVLAGQFVAHDYDLKRAMRWMVLSDAFSRSSQPAGGGLADMPESGKPLFSRYYMRPMKAEDVYRSLVTAADLRQKANNPAALEQARRDWLSELHRSMGTDDGEEESHEGGNRQVELMLNSRLIRQAVSADEDGQLGMLVKSDMPMPEKIEHLFLAALSRKPTAQEQQAIGQILTSAKDNQAAALEDIWWALLNSNEFILDH
jgi:hypothetical protein